MQNGLLVTMSNPIHISVPDGKKIYFASDNHLGAPNKEASLPREKKFVAWLDRVKHDAAAIFCLVIFSTFGWNIGVLCPKDLPEHWVN